MQQSEAVSLDPAFQVADFSAAPAKEPRYGGSLEPTMASSYQSKEASIPTSGFVTATGSPVRELKQKPTSVIEASLQMQDDDHAGHRGFPIQRL